jgi:hypothetical protein
MWASETKEREENTISATTSNETGNFFGCCESRQNSVDASGLYGFQVWPYLFCDKFLSIHKPPSLFIRNNLWQSCLAFQRGTMNYTIPLSCKWKMFEKRENSRNSIQSQYREYNYQCKWKDINDGSQSWLTSGNMEHHRESTLFPTFQKTFPRLGRRE